MLYNATLNPGVLEQNERREYWNLVVSVLREFVNNCLLLSLWDGALERELARHAENIDHRFRPDILALLGRLRDQGRFVPIGRCASSCPDNDSAWLEEAFALGKPDELFAVIARERDILASACARSSEKSVAVETAAINRRWNSRRNNRAVTRCSDQIMPQVAPVLRYSKRVWLVDYMLFKVLNEGRGGARRFFPSIRQCLGVWASNVVKRVEFLIHTEVSAGYSQGHLEAMVQPWRPTVEAYLPTDSSRVAIRFWRSNDQREFHRNRFLSTEIACIKIGKGFDFSDGRSSRKPDMLTLLDDDAARAVDSEFALYEGYQEVSLR